MTTTFGSITFLGQEVEVAKDNNTYLILVPSLETLLGWSKDQARKKIASKGLKDALGLTPRLGKKKDNRGNARGYVGTIDTRLFMQLVGWEASNGNKIAIDILVALANETLERRIDSALNVNTPEEDYEARTKAFFREMARKSFIPEYTSYLTQLEVTPMYGAEVNKLKLALGLPLSSIDTYSSSHMKTWCSGLTRYDCLRMEGYSHKRALNRIALVRAAREE